MVNKTLPTSSATRHNSCSTAPPPGVRKSKTSSTTNSGQGSAAHLRGVFHCRRRLPARHAHAFGAWAINRSPLSNHFDAAADDCRRAPAARPTSSSTASSCSPRSAAIRCSGRPASRGNRGSRAGSWLPERAEGRAFPNGELRRIGEMVSGWCRRRLKLSVMDSIMPITRWRF